MPGFEFVAPLEAQALTLELFEMADDVFHQPGEADKTYFDDSDRIRNIVDHALRPDTKLVVAVPLREADNEAPNSFSVVQMGIIQEPLGEMDLLLKRVRLPIEDFTKDSYVAMISDYFRSHLQASNTASSAN